MTSALDTLLEAARFIELQEQQRLAATPSPPSATSIGGRYHHQHHHLNHHQNNNNSTNITSSGSNSNIINTNNISSSTNGNNSINHSNNNTRNSSRHYHQQLHHNHQQHHQVSSPPISPVFAASNGAAVGIGGINTNHNSNINSNNNSHNHDYSEYGTTTTQSIRSNDGRNATGNNNGGSIGSSTSIIHNGSVHHVLSAATEDSSQSSLNLSSSGYLSGSSVNSSLGSNSGGGGIINGNSGSNLNLNSSTSSSLMNGSSSSSNGGISDHHMPMQPTQTTGRRRTTSTNSNTSGTQRSPCIIRAGTREVHNKLEKHRRAHLKECFEQLKVQLQLKDEEKKKTSNLAILGAAYRHVMSLKRKERELEQQVEQLAKEKINAQKKILNLKRELSAKYDNIDIANIVSDGDIGNIPGERDSLSDSVSLSSGRGSTRYSSSSSLSSAATVSSPIGSSMQTTMPTAISPVISSVSSSTSPNLNSPHLMKSSSPIGINNQTVSMPLSLTTKSHSPSLLTTRESPTQSLLSSPSSLSSGISTSPPVVSSSSSPPIGIISTPIATAMSSAIGALKMPNHVPNGVKLTGSATNISLVSSTTNRVSSPIVHLTSTSDANALLATAASAGLPLNLNASQNVQILSAAAPKDFSNGGKNGICRKVPAPDIREQQSQNANMILTSNSGIGSAKELKVEKIFDGSEQPHKVIKLFNGIALAPVDKDNKLISSAPLTLSQVVGGGGLVVSPFPMLTTSSQGLRVIGQAPNGLATIELSSPTVQSHQRNHQQSTSPPMSALTASSGAQLHKLLVNGTTATAVTTGSISGVTSSPITHMTSVAPELARLPGGAELNILPTGTNGTTLYRGNGKLAIVNNGITLKGADANGASGRAVHVVTPLQSGGTPISGLTPIVVSQGQAGSNLAHIIASTPQLAGKVNLSVGGQALPLISTQYLSSMKPMVVAVASNTTPTLSSVPPTSTSAATATANGGSS